jgi:hypothetical protein
LCTQATRPDASATAVSPALPFGRSVGTAGVHVRPPSGEPDRYARPSVLRISATGPSGPHHSAGWMCPAPVSAARSTGIGARSHDVPSSAETSTNGLQRGRTSHSSTDAGASQSPAGVRSGGFFTGPRPPERSPGTSSRTGSQVSPPSVERVTSVIHSEIRAPTLQNSQTAPSGPGASTGFQCATSRPVSSIRVPDGPAT